MRERAAKTLPRALLICGHTPYKNLPRVGEVTFLGNRMLAEAMCQQNAVEIQKSEKEYAF